MPSEPSVPSIALHVSRELNSSRYKIYSRRGRIRSRSCSLQFGFEHGELVTSQRQYFRSQILQLVTTVVRCSGLNLRKRKERRLMLTMSVIYLDPHTLECKGTPSQRVLILRPPWMGYPKPRTIADRREAECSQGVLDNEGLVVGRLKAISRWAVSESAE